MSAERDVRHGSDAPRFLKARVSSSTQTLFRIARGTYQYQPYGATHTLVIVGQTSGRSCEDRPHTLQVPVKDVYLCRLRR